MIFSTFVENTIGMDETKIACLESEIVKLNKLIAVLIEQNDALKAKIAYVEKGIAIQNVISPYVESGIATPNIISSYVETEIGGNDVTSRLPETEIGGNNPTSRSPKIESGENNLISPYVKTETGVNNLISGLPKTEIGGNQLVSEMPEKDIGDNKIQPSIPYFIPLSPENINKLYQSYGPGFFFRVKQNAKWAMTLILLQAYNKSGCSYSELQKLTQRSEGGMTKLIASLKKRGLVERSGKSSFRLTPLALDFIRKANCNPQGVDFREPAKKK